MGTELLVKLSALLSCCAGSLCRNIWGLSFLACAMEQSLSLTFRLRSLQLCKRSRQQKAWLRKVSSEDMALIAEHCYGGAGLRVCPHKGPPGTGLWSPQKLDGLLVTGWCFLPLLFLHPHPSSPPPDPTLPPKLTSFEIGTSLCNPDSKQSSCLSIQGARAKGMFRHSQALCQAF